MTRATHQSKSIESSKTGDVAKHLRWQIRSVGNEGFEFGLDRVTPISWRIVRSRMDGKSAYAFDLPDPKPQETAYAEWLKSHRGKSVVYSVLEARKAIIALRGVV